LLVAKAEKQSRAPAVPAKIPKKNNIFF